MHSINWSYKTFDQLQPGELYEIIQLRIEVFVVEQQCNYQDLDGKDAASVHVMGKDSSGKLVAYCRIVPPGISYADTASIGRVITAPSHRGQGLGRPLMLKALEIASTQLGYHTFTISAQSHLQAFYESVGFRRTTQKEYLEDDIPHREMMLIL